MGPRFECFFKTPRRCAPRIDYTVLETIPLLQASVYVGHSLFHVVTPSICNIALNEALS